MADTAASDVSILRWNDDDFTNVLLKIPVDATIQQLSVKVSGQAPRQKTTLYDPSG